MRTLGIVLAICVALLVGTFVSTAFDNAAATLDNIYGQAPMEGR